MKKINRTIAVFHKTGSEFLLAELMLPDVAINDLVRIINPASDDPTLYRCYQLSFDQLAEIFNLIPDSYHLILNIDFTIYEYHLEVSV
ncbi:MAG: hypothetical protein ACI8YQ_001990 [Polaribacter sp.]|jgi:hypothetical protein